MMTKKKIAFLFASSSIMALLLGAALFGQVAPRDNVYKYLSVFTEVFSLVKSSYVEDVPTEQLVDGAFNGITDAIDEYSYYVPPTQMAAYKSYTDDESNEIGAVVSKRFGYAYVIAPVKGSLADKAGIRTGDFIEKIDDRPTAKMAVWQIRNALTRNDGKPLHLTVVHSGLTKREHIEIKRVPFAAPIPKLERYGNVAYVALPFFGKGTAEGFADALTKAHKAGLKKLIVDVRGNAGGSIDEAIRSADLLLHGGVITTTAGRRVEAKRFEADSATSYDGEVLVLTDRSTASGAEVFAGAIHGNNRGKTVGVPSYGKAIIQKLIPLPSGGALFMTVAHYTTPDAKVIKDQGLRPDVLVDLTPNLLAKRDDKQPQQEDDLILKKALTLFGEKEAAERIAA
jgi:carboxyl-terminal processing protease